LSYLSKNLKTLRTKNGFSQEQFARMFGLSKSNINSYENGVLPKIEKFIQIMDFYELDPSKFLKLDLAKHSLTRTKDFSDESEEELSQKVDDWLDADMANKMQFEFLENLSKDEMKELYMKQYRIKEDLLKENLELKARYIKLLEGK